jgi:hypothetical protein
MTISAPCAHAIDRSVLSPEYVADILVPPQHGLSARVQYHQAQNTLPAASLHLPFPGEVWRAMNGSTRRLQDNHTQPLDGAAGSI